VAETGPPSPLSNATVYSLAQRLLGASAVRAQFVEQYLRPVPGERILDLGCGPADILAALPPVEYVGVDADPAYVAAAERRFGDRGTFHCADVRDPNLVLGDGFDAVISIGLLHHLDDRSVQAAALRAASALREGGRFLTLDPARVPGASRIAAWLLDRDRGRHIRTPEAYRALIARQFGSAEPHVRSDLARLPYPHVILDCRHPREQGAAA
jgi:SAM-dependent methyltransferase